MNLKNEKGITNIDIIVSIIIITLFVAIIATLMSNINGNSDSVERRAEATNYAINEIERLKATTFSDLVNEQINDFQTILDENDQPTGYSKKITVTDYADLEENQNNTNIVPDLVKKVTVEIGYQDGNTTQIVDLSTVITKNS